MTTFSTGDRVCIKQYVTRRGRQEVHRQHGVVVGPAVEGPDRLMVRLDKFPDEPLVPLISMLESEPDDERTESSVSDA